mmetsp:Transcript_29465/g.50257  ORF Transcript_29465/g.50257 Transcript_29465/m.50257 type:complete len:87 (+) Transcript_29465:436-696(+)
MALGFLECLRHELSGVHYFTNIKLDTLQCMMDEQTISTSDLCDYHHSSLLLCRVHLEPQNKWEPLYLATGFRQTKTRKRGRELPDG